MCAGDLGMYRVMPWAYPPISGGSSGGFSPDDSGGTGESGSTNALYVDTDNTTFNMSELNIWNNGKADYATPTLIYGYLGVGNLRNVSTVKEILVINDLYLSDDPSKNVVNLLMSNILEYRTNTLPWDTPINGTTSINGSYKFNTSIDETQTAVLAHFTLKLVAYDSDGNEIRSYSHDLEWKP